jgi:peptidoglycan-associated lipoprotein
MKPLLPVLIGFAALMAGCHKHAPVAAAPKAPDTTPVAAAPPPERAPAPARAPERNTPEPVAQTPRSTTIPPEVRAQLNTLLAKLDDALFDFDKSTIRPDASTVLKDDLAVIRDILAAYPSQKLVIQGFADQRGSEEYNLALGDRRAQAVKDFLGAAGIPENQLTVISYGKDRPVCADENEACYQRNRRAHVTAAE